MSRNFSIECFERNCISVNCFAILAFVLSCNVAWSQSHEIDSLRAQIAVLPQDTSLVVTMIKLSTVLKDEDLELAHKYGAKALELSKKFGSEESEARSSFILGRILFDTQDRASSLAHFEQCERLSEKLGLNKLRVDNFMRIANYHRYSSKDSVATVDYLHKAIELGKQIDYKYGVARSYAKIASFYSKYKDIDLCQENLELASKYYLQVPGGNNALAHYYNEVGDKIWNFNPRKSMDLYLKGLEFSEEHPNIKVNLAKAYNFIGEPRIALDYLKQAIPKIDERKNTRMQGIALAQLAEVYIQLGNYSEAITACDEGIELLTPLGRTLQRALPSIYRFKGIAVERTGDPEGGLALYEKSRLEAKRVRNQFDQVKAELAIGEYYMNRDYNKSLEFCNKALEISKSKHYTNSEIEACSCLYKLHRAKQNNDLAIEYFEKKVALSDSLHSLKLKHVLDINSEMTDKDKQLAEKAHEEYIRTEQLKNQKSLNLILSSAAIVGLLLIGFLMISIKRIRKQNEEIIKKTKELQNVNQSLGRSNSELERFAHIASHDLKSPLKNIISFTGLLRKNLEKNGVSDPVKQSLHFIESSGKTMSQLIEDILEYSKLSSQTEEESELKAINLNRVVDEISQLVDNSLEGKDVTIDAEPLFSVNWNHSKIFLLFKNLIENGIKYNETENPTVKIYSSTDVDRYVIYFEDNGIGIEPEYYDKIFSMFQRLHNHERYEGTGLGLATCKKIVDEFEGEISVSSTVGRGSIFKIVIPENMVHVQEKTSKVAISAF